MIRCEQGDDVAIWLALPDGTLIDADFLEDSSTRQATSFSDWEAFESDERECKLAKEIVQAEDTSTFDLEVRRCFDATYAAEDQQLPSM